MVRTPCGTKCCAVGWVAEAFGVTASPYGSADRQGWGEENGARVAPVGSPMHKFARKFAKNLGADMPEFDERYKYDGLIALSDLFEDGVPEDEAAEAWNKTVKQCGYTIPTKIDWEE